MKGFAGRLTMPRNRPFRILQLTDLHYMDNSLDPSVDARILDLVRFATPDLVIFTGDQVMCPTAIALYGRLRATMEQLSVPWTLVFGNHDAEHGNAKSALRAAAAGSRFVWPSDPVSDDSDFVLEIGDDWLVFGLDSHNDATYDIGGTPKWGYGTILPTQIEWIGGVLRSCASHAGRILPSVIFQHIPPAVVRTWDDPGASRFRGEKNEAVCAAPIDFGYHAALVANKSAKGVFFGHDHVNDFAFERDGITYAYGRVSGQHDYAMPGFPKGGRIVDLHPDGTFDTYVLLHRDAR
ncbi:MAG TPA: hypothetical protein DCR44_02665 [Acholeplasmatales bacterium]|nr:MAG: hypothetical protein A2Y16_07170 [Tenericutes bacterium GWF2_57_13]HAQ56296.1 hypothetical protein [Acholeplasmatales bacterium]